MGRPSKYRAEFDEQAEKLCILGATDAQLADFFEVTVSTINEWKLAYPSFSESLKAGKERADSEVAKSLYRRALGYSHPAEKIMQYEGEVVRAEYTEHYPPDTTACIFWLKNRRPDVWRDVHRVEHGGTIKHAHQMTDDDLASIAARGSAGVAEEAASAPESPSVH